MLRLEPLRLAVERYAASRYLDGDPEVFSAGGTKPSHCGLFVDDRSASVELGLDARRFWVKRVHRVCSQHTLELVQVSKLLDLCVKMHLNR
jgi:hypothetical protein